MIVMYKIDKRKKEAVIEYHGSLTSQLLYRASAQRYLYWHL